MGKDSLANDQLGTEKESVDVVGEDRVNDAYSVKVCQLSLGLTRSLYSAQSSQHVPRSM